MLCLTVIFRARYALITHERGPSTERMVNNSKEQSVLESKDEVIKLESLAELTGFPVELIKKELFKNEELTEGVSLDKLRDAMTDYIDATMLEGEQVN